MCWVIESFSYFLYSSNLKNFNLIFKIKITINKLLILFYVINDGISKINDKGIKNTYILPTLLIFFVPKLFNFLI